MDIFIASIGIFFAELYGNLVGGGSLVTQAVLQNMLGFELKNAMALDNAAVIGSNIGMLIILWKKFKIKWWYFLFIVFQTIGAYLGAIILIKIDINLLRTIFIITIIGLVIKNLFIKTKENEKEDFKETPLNFFYLSLSAIFIGMYNGAFVIGDWIISILILTSMFKIEYKHAIFILVFSMIFSQPIAFYKYYESGLLDMNFLIPMIFATFLSGICAGIILGKIKSNILEKILKFLSIFLVIYLIFGILN